MTGNKTNKRSFSMLNMLGILFALLLCLVSCAMVYVAIPSASPLLQLFIDSDTNTSLGLSNSVDTLSTPTPFQPAFIATLEIVDPEVEPLQSPQPEVKPTPTPRPADTPDFQEEDLPASASISGVKGSPQLYTLDCESQTAVDWARFFGTYINHQEFIDRLPRSDDPEEGFVGEINGAMGQIPPNAYGVHAPPVAALLRDYGLPAAVVRDWGFEKIKREIADGRPVIVWIVNLPFEIETHQYTAPNGNTSTVARFQHTWIITAYNSSSVTVVDSKWTYNVRIPTFLQRWEALGKQTIIFIPDI
jgi:uncharacterized protein YvpB